MKKKVFAINNRVNSCVICLMLNSCDEKTGSKSPPESDVSSKKSCSIITFDFDEKSSTWNYEFKVAPGVVLIGSEFESIAPGLVPDILIDFSKSEVTKLNIKSTYGVVHERAFVRHKIDFFEGESLVSTQKSGRDWSLVSFFPEKLKRNILEDVYSYQFGRLEKDELVSRPTIYYGPNIESLKNKVKISDSIPMWKWSAKIIEKEPR